MKQIFRACNECSAFWICLSIRQKAATQITQSRSGSAPLALGGQNTIFPMRKTLTTKHGSCTFVSFIKRFCKYLGYIFKNQTIETIIGQINNLLSFYFLFAERFTSHLKCFLLSVVYFCTKHYCRLEQSKFKFSKSTN